MIIDIQCHHKIHYLVVFFKSCVDFLVFSGVIFIMLLLLCVYGITFIECLILVFYYIYTLYKMYSTCPGSCVIIM